MGGCGRDGQGRSLCVVALGFLPPLLGSSVFAEVTHVPGDYPFAQAAIDVAEDGDTDTADLLILLGTWGDCP